MVPISFDDYIRKHRIANPDDDITQVKKSLRQAVLDKQNGAKCHCGRPIWAIGSALLYMACFTCLTGEADSSKDYEIDEVCW
jgi:hypothetical protein